MLPRALLYLRTLRMLRPVQLAYLPVRRMQRTTSARPTLMDPVPPMAPNAALASTLGSWGAGDEPARMTTAAGVMAGRFEFLNHQELLQPVDWAERRVSHLWNYHLHYFDYALDLAWMHRLTGRRDVVQTFLALTGSWIEQTRSGAGDGWEPYAISVRVVNWIRALLLFGEAIDRRDRERLQASLAAQLRWLERRLEYHLLANHLQKNYLALAMGGLYFRGPQAERWLANGVRGLWQELEEQVLPDGTHFERSPMYHAIALEDYLLIVGLLKASGRSVPGLVCRGLGHMTDALMVLSRESGGLHLFNDSANEVAPSRTWLLQLARSVIGHEPREMSGVAVLPDGGYYAFADTRRGDRIVIDCGEPGPRYQPGHAHCDLLSYELDLRGVAVVVDAGVSGYDGDRFREYVRSTRAHNTLSISGREQSELWGTFRLGRRGQPLEATSSTGDQGFQFAGGYTPYFDRRVVCRRRVECLTESWRITDRVDGAGGAKISSHIHLHPEFEIVQAGAELVLARSPRLTVSIEPFGVDRISVFRGSMEPIQGWYCPEFGRQLPATTLELHGRSDAGPLGYHLRAVQ
jgi:uncharacterized heparinase superfamily protein